MDALCLSLGHNSSAILIRDGKILGGYETERFTKVKSESAFPLIPISVLDSRFDIAKDVEIMVGHWALDGNLNSMKEKHWNPGFLKANFPACTIQSLSAGSFTHHDSHAYSALAFAGNDFPKELTYILVMDGFGTLGEHISVYRLYDNVPVLQWRRFGFGTSMGLFYQYTTAFLGMKQNQDEYKLLAFEAHIDDALSYVSEVKLKSEIRKWSDYFCLELSSYESDPSTDPLCNIAALPEFAKRVTDILSSVLDAIDYEKRDDKITKIVISYFTQSVVENVVRFVIGKFPIKNIILVGGLFYNVKLNNLASRLVSGKTCIMPLAGDQGAALGIYHAKYTLQWPGHVFWGHRDLYRVPIRLPNGIMVARDSDEGLTIASEILRKDGYVNVVRGAMEFGPRALCHTTTFADPTNRMSEYVNTLNNRVNEMPFAPVVSRGAVEKLFESTEKIHKSLEYMIVTRDYRDQYGEINRYAAHKDVARGVYTGRPQITDDPYVVRMLAQHNGILINTSYNFHGVPIVNDWDDILFTHNMQSKHATEGRLPSTVVITGE